MKLEYIEFRRNNGCSNYAFSILCIITRLICSIYTTEKLFNQNYIDHMIDRTLAKLGRLSHECAYLYSKLAK